jgi:hypothetical protein
MNVKAKIEKTYTFDDATVIQLITEYLNAQGEEVEGAYISVHRSDMYDPNDRDSFSVTINVKSPET